MVSACSNATYVYTGHNIPPNQIIQTQSWPVVVLSIYVERYTSTGSDNYPFKCHGSELTKKAFSKLWQTFSIHVPQCYCDSIQCEAL